jgi:hypothetical protein
MACFYAYPSKCSKGDYKLLKNSFALYKNKICILAPAVECFKSAEQALLRIFHVSPCIF